jgi:ribonuclease III
MKAARPKRTRLRAHAKAVAARAPSTASAAAVEAASHHRFKNPLLLTQALTHPSSVAASDSVRLSNQRLEFFGDRVLGLVIAERLYALRQDESEGELAPLLNRLVRKGACAEAMRALDLGQFIIVSESEAASGGRARESTLGDACEAIIGALYLDGGLSPARRFIEAGWAGQFSAPPEDARDPKSLLQEWAQGRGLPRPDYDVVGRSGPDHAPEYEVEVRVQNNGTATARGASKRVAERLAAERLLKHLTEIL